MLPGRARLTRSQDFTAALRGGRRSGRPLVVVHLRKAQTDVPTSAETSALPVPLAPARVGFVTNKAVGNAVVRNQVRRRLRHVMASRLAALPAGSLMVVRALPASASASSADLAVDLDRAMERLGVRP